MKWFRRLGLKLRIWFWDAKAKYHIRQTFKHARRVEYLEASLEQQLDAIRKKNAMQWEMEPDAAALVDAWLNAKPGMRVVRALLTTPDRIRMEFCDRRSYGWMVTTVDVCRFAWVENGPIGRAFMLRESFAMAEEANLMDNPEGLKRDV